MPKQPNLAGNSWENRERLSVNIEPGMIFTMQKKIGIIDDSEDNAVVVSGIRFKKGMKFELKRDLRLRKEAFGEETGIEIEGKRKFHFLGDDVIIVDSVDKEKAAISFHVERKKKKVKNDTDEVVQFTVQSDIFVNIFEGYADIEIQYMNNFRFKRDDKVIVIEKISEPFDHQEPAKETQIKTEIRFKVERQGNILTDSQGKEILFTFNALMFVQRFENISDIEDVVTSTKDFLDGLVPPQQK